MPLENSINDQNRPLYEWLSTKGIEINFSVEDAIPSWQVKQTWKISAPDDQPNPAAMTHELLHIKLYAKGFADDISVYRYFNRSNSPFTIEFIGQTNNDLAHFKMIDDFLEMGFPVDDFLQDTPKTYFLKGMIYTTMKLVLEHKAGTKSICEQILEIVRLVTGAKLFELYKIKDTETKNGLHPDAVLAPLKEINKELVEGIENLLIEWNEADTVDNLQFFARLNSFLKSKDIPTHNECNKSMLAE